MKKFTVAVLVAAGCILSAGTARAQNAHEVRVNVPFAFAIGNKVLPAGNYRIEQQASPVSANEILIQDIDHPRFAVLVRGSDGPWQALPTVAASRGRLVFDQYGDDRFLREIRGPFSAVNVEIPKSHAEQRVEHRERASVASPSETMISIGN